MKVRVWSDLHMEGATMAFSQDCQDEVLVLAGDISNCATSAAKVCNYLAKYFLAVVYVPGNHEYYKGTTWTEFPLVFNKSLEVDNVYLLNTKQVMIGSVTFIGATLWSDFDKGNPHCIVEAKRFINDFRVAYSGEHMKMTPEWQMKEHKYDFNFIREACKAISGKKVVVTHFPPSRKFQHPRWGTVRESPLNGYFMSELDIEDLEFNLWVCGHTHDFSDFEQDGKRFVCNPRGYMYRGNSENQFWDINKVIEV